MSVYILVKKIITLTKKEIISRTDKVDDKKRRTYAWGRNDDSKMQLYSYRCRFTTCRENEKPPRTEKRKRGVRPALVLSPRRFSFGFHARCDDCDDVNFNVDDNAVTREPGIRKRRSMADS